MSIRILDEDGNEVNPDELEQALQSWIGFKGQLHAIDVVSEEHKLAPDVKKAFKDQAILQYSILVGFLTQYATLMSNRQTPYYSMQVALSTVLEYMFSAMIAEKQAMGKKISGEEAQAEFMEVCKMHAYHVIGELTEAVNKGEFQIRVGTTVDERTNAPSTMTRQ